MTIEAHRPDLTDESKTEAEAIRSDIEATRAQLGDTVEALAAKTDVKARLRATLDDTKHGLVDKARDTAIAARDIRDHLRERRSRSCH